MSGTVYAEGDEFVRGLRGLAYHEAGHAVVDALLHRRLQSVTLIRQFDGDRVVSATGVTTTKGPIWWYGMSGEQEYRAVEREAVSLVAGAMGAELGLGTCAVGGLSGPDRRHLHTALCYLAADESGGDSTPALREAIQEQVTKTARNLLTKHRRALHCVAKALQIRGTLSGCEVRTILRQEKRRPNSARPRSGEGERQGDTRKEPSIQDPLSGSC